MIRGNLKSRLASSLVFAMALGGGVGPVGAQLVPAGPVEGAEVECLLTEAIELRRARRDEEALRLVEQARVLSASSRVRAHLAAAHQAVGHWLHAERLWRELLESDDAYIASRAATLKRAHEFVQRHLRRMDVLERPAQPELLRCGRSSGVAPPAEPAVQVEGHGLERAEGRVFAHPSCGCSAKSAAGMTRRSTTGALTG